MSIADYIAVFGILIPIIAAIIIASINANTKQRIKIAVLETQIGALKDEHNTYGKDLKNIFHKLEEINTKLHEKQDRS